MSCPAFDGPHLGPTADPSLVAAIPSAVNDDDDAIKPSGIGNGSNDIDDEDNDDDEDGAFGDFWRASARYVQVGVDVCAFVRLLQCCLVLKCVHFFTMEEA